MGYVSIDIDLSEFDTDDLVDEICDRKLSQQQTRDLTELLIDTPFELNKLSLVDRIKYDFFIENISKISLEQLENLI